MPTKALNPKLLTQNPIFYALQVLEVAHLKIKTGLKACTTLHGAVNPRPPTAQGSLWLRITMHRLEIRRVTA